MFQEYIEKAEKLDIESAKLREIAARWKYNYGNIYLGILIKDMDTGQVKKVVKLKGDYNDFVAESLDVPGAPLIEYNYKDTNFKILDSTDLALENSINYIFNIVGIMGAGKYCPPKCRCGDKGCSKLSIRESLYRY